MKQELVLDVSDLPPPEPLEKVLEATETLASGQYIRMLHRQEPFPLYDVLGDIGFKHLTRVGQKTSFEIFIWRNSDEAAELAVFTTIGGA
ncbi:MAG: DUF2249 domain-containing protein [Gammaproteobacteria bacterium]|nr:DUF2249 domain-containing protein [Gammaproteobacteria bacterium]